MQLNLMKLFLVLLLALVLVDRSAAARGGRSSSSSRSSSRYSSSSRSYRSSSRYGSSRGTGYSSLSLLVRSRFSYRVNRLAYTRGIFLSSWYWRRSRSDYSESASLCFNVMDSLPDEYNSSVVEPWLYQNRTVYGLFVCPIDPERPDRVYCCGEDEQQTCCSFWEDGGRVAGLAIGLILGSAICAFFAYKIYKGYKNRKPTTDSHSQNVNLAVGNPAMEVSNTSAASVNPPAATAPTNQEATSSADSGAAADSTNKPPEQPFNYYGQQQPELLPPPYPETLPPPPSYWDVNSPGQPQELTPVRT